MFMQGLGHIVTVLGLGLMLGVEHALDADHVAAVSTITSEKKSLKSTSRIAAFWGMGHTATLLAVGIFVLGFKLKISGRFAASMEFLVGAMLVFLGASVFLKVWNGRMHSHEHTHDGYVHDHIHPKSEPDHAHDHRALFVGMIHGLAGSSALMLLVLSTISSFGLGVMYILAFGIGSIAGMLAISMCIGLPFVLTRRYFKLNRMIRMAAGAVSFILGFTIMFKSAGLLWGI